MKVAQGEPTGRLGGEMDIVQKVMLAILSVSIGGWDVALKSRVHNDCVGIGHDWMDVIEAQDVPRVLDPSSEGYIRRRPHTHKGV
ncbi:hypothetical protein Tco_0558143 [Tanacetum coccineum]